MGGVSRYTWEDRAGLAPGATYFYWVEDVNIYGAATRHGPVSVTYGVPTTVTVNGFRPQAALPTGWLLAAGLIALAVLVGAVAKVWQRSRTNQESPDRW